MKNTLKRLCFGALAASLGAASQAQLLAYDGFNYTAGALSGQNGGTGFTSAYVTSGSTVSVASTGLTHAGLTGSFAPVGGAMSMANNQNLSNASINGRNWQDATPTQPGVGEFWYSMLVNPSTAGGTLVPFTGTTSNTNGQNGWGVRVDAAGGGTTVNIKAWSPTQAASPLISILNGYGATYFIVGKLSIGATNTTNTIWVNPALGGVAPTTGGVSIAQLPSAAFVTRLSGRSFSSPTGNMIWDEVRIGRTAGDVMPLAVVPEPASCFALATGLSALFVRRRRKA